ncbi:MAG TPA: exonuclease domain-containing protein, partial [Burkholderiales bacterium]|nr:exonuclease domain-containing protein [Burkholderiales bacterium]
MRQIVLDTETTGLDPQRGHRIIELAAVELRDRRVTDSDFHRYLNPERESDAAALAVHGISNEFLLDKPRFREVAREFLEFVGGAELIIHNADFDLAFLDHELALVGLKPLVSYCGGVTDTLRLA